jgi:hypothetical protein
VDVVLYRDSRDAAAARSCAGPVIDESVIHTSRHTVMMSQESDSRIKIQD